jgi:hypothetical protein
MTRIINSDFRDQCRSDRPDPYPVHILKRVDRPTTKINEDEIQRVDERRGGFHRAGLGEFGQRLQTEYKRFVPKHPLSGALVTMAGALGHMVDAPTLSGDESKTPWGVSSWAPMKPIAEHQAPLTDDPKAMSSHIKETAYFLRADMVGICELPPYAVYTHRKHDGKPVELNHKNAPPCASGINKAPAVGHASRSVPGTNHILRFTAPLTGPCATSRRCGERVSGGMMFSGTESQMTIKNGGWT